MPSSPDSPDPADDLGPEDMPEYEEQALIEEDRMIRFLFGE